MDWSKYFSHIYCFHFLGHGKRLESISDELRRVGILDSGIFSFVYTSRDPWESVIAERCPRVFANDEPNIGFINLGLATARTMREALALGHERCLFLENDIRFLKDVREIERIVSNIPVDYDVVQLDKFMPWEMTNDQYRSEVDGFRINDDFFDGRTNFYPSGGCFSANRNGMQRLVESLENNGPRPVDGIFGSVGARRAVVDRNVAVQVVFNNAMIWNYMADNTHHRAYAPMNLDYGLYNVPDGYGYGARCAVE